MEITYKDMRDNVVVIYDKKTKTSQVLAVTKIPEQIQ